MENDNRITDLRKHFGDDIDKTCTLIEFSWCSYFLKIWADIAPKDRSVEKLESLFNLFFKRYKVRFTFNDIDNVQTKGAERVAWEVFSFHKEVLIINIISYLTNVLLYDLILDKKSKK